MSTTVTPSLTRAERSRVTAELLAEAAATADPARRSDLLDEVVVVNCRVADAVATRYRGRGVPLDDLKQVAYEGLVKAVRRYDHDHAEDLLTFAVPTIRGEILRHFRDRSWMVRPPRRIQELQQRLSAAIADLRDVLGREPSDAELTEYLGVDETTYSEAVGAFGCFAPPSLDRLYGEDESGASLGDLLTDDLDEQEAADARAVLSPVLRTLDEHDRRLLQLRFYDERSQREIAEALGMTQGQVSRRLDRILRELRDAVGSADAA